MLDDDEYLVKVDGHGVIHELREITSLAEVGDDVNIVSTLDDVDLVDDVWRCDLLEESDLIINNVGRNAFVFEPGLVDYFDCKDPGVLLVVGDVLKHTFVAYTGHTFTHV